MEPLRFYFDFISPYAYLGWQCVRPLVARNGREIEPVPILFAALLNHYGHLGPVEIPPKRKYVFKDILRQAHDLDVVVAPPLAHPFNPLLALRIAGLDLDPPNRHRVIDVLFDAIWVNGQGVEDPEIVRHLLDVAGLEGLRLVSEACEHSAKAQLSATTQEALECGVFGVPTVEVHGEFFWGVDSFKHLERFLAGKDPIDHEQLSAWNNIPVGTSRKRRY
ncbi:MAG: 2-hydroxychromene-2-carboxylate isomerase [Myxococcales bacterium]|nr:2-hydroxychromene-2-carboxylate isomerase [Myxococcales bacterium]